MYTYISELIGQTFKKVFSSGEDELIFESDTHKYIFYHYQDCCEHVYIESITGDLEDLVGVPLLVAEERTSEVGPKLDVYDEVCEWTFYEFRTIKGSVTVRWYGSSNGYYSTSVNLRTEVIN